MPTTSNAESSPSRSDREAILRALDDPPSTLAELRGVLVREHKWRLAHGLV
jgi:hypothetical protein